MLLSLLTSSAGRFAAASLVLAGLGSWGWLERVGRQAAELEAGRRAAMLVENEAALAEVRARSALTTAALERQAVASAAVAARAESVRRSVYASPPTFLCAGAPAVRALLAGLRRQPAAGGAGGAADRAR